MRISVLTYSIVLTVLLLAHQAVVPSEAQAWARMDAATSARFVARSGVRTAYENLRRNGLSWQYIRDKKLPKILDRVILGLQDRYSDTVLVDIYIPAFAEAFYDEIDKINYENYRACLKPTVFDFFADIIITACKKYLSINVTISIQKAKRPSRC